MMFTRFRKYNDVNFAVTSNFDKSSLLITFRRPGVSLTETWTTANTLLTKLELNNNITKGLKIEGLGEFVPSSQNFGAKTNIHFQQPGFHARTFVDLLKGPTATIDTVVGRDGFLWSGDAYVGRKSEWATWTPPKEMIRRQPEAAKYAHGMPGGLDNPLGARTLHLYQNGAYTLYTIYASSDAESIGTGITSGCVGLISQDMIHLYARTPVRTKVVVLPA